MSTQSYFKDLPKENCVKREKSPSRFALQDKPNYIHSKDLAMKPQVLLSTLPSFSFLPVFSARSVIWCDTDPSQYAYTISKREMTFLPSFCSKLRIRKNKAAFHFFGDVQRNSELRVANLPERHLGGGARQTANWAPNDPFAKRWEF